MIATIVSGQILDRVQFPANYQVVFLIGAIGAILSSYHIGRYENLRSLLFQLLL